MTTLQKRWRFSTKVLVPAAASLVTTAAVVVGFVLWAAGNADQQSLARETELATHVMQTQLERIPHDQESITIWDDSIEHLRQYDPDWLDLNIGVWLYTYFGHDEVVVVDDHNQPVYAQNEGKRIDPAAAQPELDELMPMVDRLRRSVAGGLLGAYADGSVEHPPRVSDFAMVRGVPSLVSVVPMVSDSGEIAQPQGTEYLHISIVHLDDDYAERLGKEYLIPQASFSTLSAESDASAGLPLTNISGRIVSFFNWTKSTPGLGIVRQTLPVLALAFLAAALLASVLIYQIWRKQRAIEFGRAEAQHRSLHDTLTGLPNRVSFDAALAKQLAQRPSRDRRISVLMMDLDRFKKVNDTLGHRAGDDLLESVGQRLGEFVKEGDMLARLSGDEFAIITTHPPGASEPLLLCQRIIDALAKPFDVHGSEAFIGVSIGIATADGEEADARELARKADIALYEAKATGRNRAVIFEEAMNELLQNRHTVEAALRDALRRVDQLAVAFQPLFADDHRTIIGAEALARWTHPRLGQVSPAHFIPVAEATGLIEQLGEFVLRRACQVGAKWPGQTFAVNISPVQLRSPRFTDRVFALLSETGMRPEDLELEITEGILLEESSVSSEAIAKLRAAGIRIALDDFGTGYSSLNYLKRYPVDRIKIDRSFVSQLAPGSVSVPIVEAMVNLAHALRIEVTAEGVETRDQIQVLSQLGCNAYQGFLLSPPVAPQALEVLLQVAENAQLPEAQVA